MTLTIDDYLDRYEQKSAAYLISLAAPTPGHPNIPEQFLPQTSGMLKWSEADAHCWAGPFSGNFCFYRIRDWNNQYPKLCSTAEINEHEKTHNKYNAYTWPHTNKLCTKILGENWDSCYVGTILCSRSELTNVELDKLLTHATAEEKRQYLTVLAEMNKNLTFRKSTPSKELPVSLKLFGNDDATQTKLFPSMDSAERYLRYLEKHNTFDTIHKHFTN